VAGNIVNNGLVETETAKTKPQQRFVKKIIKKKKQATFKEKLTDLFAFLLKALKARR